MSAADAEYIPDDPEAYDAALAALNALSDRDREDMFGFFCTHCGCKQPWHPDAPAGEWVYGGCQCWNDE